MSTATAAWAILRRDFLVELSYRMRFVAQLLSALFSLALFYYLSRLVRVGFQSPQDYFEFAVIGIVILQVLNSTLLLPPGVLRQELVAGTWERLVVSPFGAAKSVLAFMLYPFARACVIGCATLGLAALLFHLTLAGPQAFLAIPVGIVATLAFAPFGIFVVAGVMIAKQVQSGATWIITGISLVGGLYFPVALLPDWIQWASEVQPFTPAVDLMRHLLVGTPLQQSAWIELAKLVGFAIVGLPLSIAAVNAALRVTRRRGTIIEY